MIKSGKCYQQQIDLKQSSSKMVKCDSKTLGKNAQATSTVGLIEHLNKNLADMLTRSESLNPKQRHNLSVIAKRFEHSITV